MSAIRCECPRPLPSGESTCIKCGHTERWIGPETHDWAEVCPRLARLGAEFGIPLDDDQALGWSDRYGNRAEAALAKLVAIAHRRRLDELARSRPSVPEPRKLVPAQPLRDVLNREIPALASSQTLATSDRFTSATELLAQRSGVSLRQINRLMCKSEQVDITTADRILLGFDEVTLDDVYPCSREAA